MQQTYLIETQAGVLVGSVSANTIVTPHITVQSIEKYSFFFERSGDFSVLGTTVETRFDRVTGSYETAYFTTKSFDTLANFTTADRIWVTFDGAPAISDIHVKAGEIGVSLSASTPVNGPILDVLSVPVDFQDSALIPVAPHDTSAFLPISNAALFDQILDFTIDIEAMNRDLVARTVFETVDSWAQTEPLRDVRLLGDSAASTLLGSLSHDTLIGFAGSDVFDAGQGDDIIHGGGGFDTAFFGAPLSDVAIEITPVGLEVTDRTGQDGSDFLTNVERLGFLDTDLEIAQFDDVSGLSVAEFSLFAELYVAYFNRAPDALGLFFWGSAYANGLSLQEMAVEFFYQAETRDTYPSGTSDAAFIAEVYGNVLGRPMDDLGYDIWLGQLRSGAVDRPTFIYDILQGAKAPAPPGASHAFLVQKAEDVAYLSTKADLGVYYAAIKGMSDVGEARTVMEIYDGSFESLFEAKNAIDNYYAAASDPVDGDFLLSVVGLIDDPFLV